VDAQTTSVTRSFDAANRLQTSTDTAVGTTSYVYDNNGNLTTVYPPGSDVSNPVGALQYTYDQRNLLLSHSINSDGTAWVLQAEYVYDGGNDRLRQVDYTGATPITTTYTNDSFGLTQVLVADDGTMQVYNLFGLDLISQDSGGEMRTLLVDGLGSVHTEMVNGAVETATTYGPYGEVLEQTGTSGTVYGFTGEQEDSATGLLYLRARYYSPALKVFQSRDPWEGSGWRPHTLNGYTYVKLNPVRFVDPLGLCESDPFDEYYDYECWTLAQDLTHLFGYDWEFWSRSGYWFDDYNYEQLSAWRDEIFSHRYIHTRDYGSFDQSHINPAAGMDIINHVIGALGRPCGHTFEVSRFQDSIWQKIYKGGNQRGIPIPETLPQGLGTGGSFQVEYWVSGDIIPAQVNRIALGIYMDLERRWENFQGTMFFSSYSHYAVEDLPSDYLGFYMATRGLQKTPENLLDVFKHLAPVLRTCSSCTPNRIEENHEFRPRVRHKGTWMNIDWPPQLQLPTPIGSSSGLWHATRENTYIHPPRWEIQ
jgi:RHS repeat-associated protein